MGDDWRHGITAEFVRRIARKHGFGNGDRKPVMPSDYGLLPRILAQGSISPGKTTGAQGLQTVKVRQTLRGQTYETVLAIRKRTSTLTVHTFYKIGGGAPR